jgi:tetratricopeptide (TPR) repeat protein
MRLSEADADDAFAQAQSAEEAGDFGTAESLYRRVMNLDPKDPAAALDLGNLLRVQHRAVEAEAAHRWAVTADPNFPPAWHNLADLLDEQGRLAEAVECEKRALDADPQYAEPRSRLARAKKQTAGNLSCRSVRRTGCITICGSRWMAS